MAKQVEVSDRVSAKLTKIERYGWTVKDKQGTWMMINKNELRIDDEYQRVLIPSKVQEMASSWSWVACGAISVAYRDESWWVMDGQHRVMASLRRDDITDLPCLVFEVENIQEEARGFLSLNTLRRPMTSVDRLRARAVAGDEPALQFKVLCDRLGVVLTRNGNQAGTTKSANWGMRRMEEDPTATTIVMELATELCKTDHIAVQEKLLGGLWHIHKNCEVGLTNARLRERIKLRGAKALLDGASKAAAYYSRGGEKVWADGMMDSINKGLRTRFKMRGEEDTAV